MFQVLVVTQGRLGSELVSAARTIAGAATNVSALALEWDDNLETARSKVSRELAGSLPV